MSLAKDRRAEPAGVRAFIVARKSRNGDGAKGRRDDRSQVANSRLWRQFVTGGDLQFASMTDALAVKNNVLALTNSGNVGIGTTGPSELLHVRKDQNTNTSILLENRTAATSANTRVQLKNDVGSISQLGIYSTSTTAYGAVAAGDAYVYSFSPGLTLMNEGPGGVIKFATGGSSEKMRIDSSGNVGIGTTTPSAKLHVIGSARVTVDLVVDGNIAAKYQDVAEWVPARHAMPAGTVVVLDTEHSNQVLPCSRAYDTSVAGVISAHPGLILGERGEGKLMVATTGRVKVKVDATSAPIRVGDLLVTSDKPGLAMRSQPLDLGGTPIHRPGTLIGKALEPLDSGVGEILVLLSLQ